MIIEKEYDFDYMPPDYFGMLRDYHRTFITDFLRQSLYLVQKDKSTIKSPVIVVGLECRIMLETSNDYYSNSIKLNNNIFEIGNLRGIKVYFDKRININKVIFGFDISEVDYYINKSQRKEKLLKLENASNTSEN